MTDAVYVTDDGQEIPHDEVERKEKCTFCGKLGTLPDGDDFLDGELPSLHGETHKADWANICRDCLVEGVNREDLNEALGTKEELRKEMQESEVELA